MDLITGPVLSQRRIVDEALALLAREGLDAVTMRRIAQALKTGPASLYAHLRNKEELYQLMLDQLVGEVTVPVPDPQRWRALDPVAVEQRVGQVRDYFAALPPDTFPHIVALAGPFTEGDGEERFEFGLEVLVAGLERISEEN